jgi:hypothetical protein
MRTITHSEFVNAAGDGVYVSTVHYANPAERVAGDAAVQRVVVAQAFVPFGDKGEPFDPPEPWPSDKTATWAGPPPCDFVSHGEALAQAQYAKALDGEGCDSVACSITQGAND